MAASIVRTCIKFSLSKQLIDIWQERSTNSILQIFTIAHFQHQCYHLTCTSYKRRQLSPNAKFQEEMLDNIVHQKLIQKSLPTIEVWNNMTVTELANSAKKNIKDVLDAMHILTKEEHEINSILHLGPLLNNIVKTLGGKPKIIRKQDEQKEEKHISEKYYGFSSSECNPSQLVKRHPVVTIMGHVDHGKTTLLDALRNTNVVNSEFGGITQHIGAFNVTLPSKDRVTFLDTPGHAAFTSMRYRGAYVTDIVVLVVAADDGVKDQTLQSIEMAKDAKVPIIVAINKIDKNSADISKTQNELAEYDVVVENLGGDIQSVNISALKRTNLDLLTEAIILQAELMNLKGDLTSPVEGVIIECSNHVGRGKLVVALIKRGTLKKGCLLISGLASAKVRNLFNDSGLPVLEAKPSDVVQIIGWKQLPDVGSEIAQVKNDKILQEVLHIREKKRNEDLAMQHKIVSDEKSEENRAAYKEYLKVRRLFHKSRKIKKLARDKFGESIEEPISDNVFNIIIKGDVAGTVETLLNILNTYASDEICRLNVIHHGIGFITDNDIELAETFNASIYGFNVTMNDKIRTSAINKGITLRLHNVVYKLIDDIKEEIHNTLPVMDMEETLGEAEVLQNIEVNEKRKKVNIAGCRCRNGVLLKSENFHVIRNDDIIYTGKLASMRHLKEEKSSIEANLECGLKFEDATISFQPKDIIVCFTVYRGKPKIEWDPGF